MNAGIEPGRSALVDRAKAIILKPKEEWPRIAEEPAAQNAVLLGYVLPLVAIGPIARLIRSQAFGYGMLGFSYRPPLIPSVINCLLGMVLGIVAVFVLMLVADFLAPKFDGTADRAGAFKLVAYGGTAAWLAGIFNLIPALGVFALLGLYSFYLFYTGAAPLMKVPQDKALPFTIVTVLCAILLMVVVAPLAGLLAGSFGFGVATIADNPDAGGKITLPGGKALDTAEFEKLGRNMQDAASGKTPPVEAAKLQELLPASIGAYRRTATETAKLGPTGSTAEGTYTAGDHEFSLRVADMSALGALAGLGAALGVEHSKQDADSYERTQSVDGQMQTEAWDNTTNSGKFGKTVANRFLIEADGKAENIEELKSAVAAVDTDALQELAQ